MSATSVLDEGEHHAVILKPAGVLSVPARGSTAATAIDLASEALGKRVFAVHRLDRQTSGCLVVAKTKYGLAALEQAFRNHLVDKRYFAWVDGMPDFKKMQIDERLRRVQRTKEHRKSHRGGAEAWQEVHHEGKSASTHLKVMTKSLQSSLVLARPQTGRLHQIRVHLAHLGHPIVGDSVYEGSYNERLHLHALCISFPTPSQKRAYVFAPPDPEFSTLTSAEEFDSALKRARNSFELSRDKDEKRRLESKLKKRRPLKKPSKVKPRRRR